MTLTKRRAATFRVNGGRTKKARATKDVLNSHVRANMYSRVASRIPLFPRTPRSSFGGARFPVQVAHVDAFPRSRAGRCRLTIRTIRVATGNGLTALGSLEIACARASQLNAIARGPLHGRDT